MNHPAQMKVEKTYRIDDAGNADVERSWILTNTNTQDIDLTNLEFYVTESVNTLGNVRAFDLSGNLDFSQEATGSDIEISVKPRISKLSSCQEYKMTLQYSFPNFVHKLREIWFFADLIEGLAEPPTSGIPKKMDVTLRVFLPDLDKKFWQSRFHSSSPQALDLSKKDKNAFRKDEALEWNCSVSSNQNYQIRLIYGVKTNTPITNFMTAVGTAFIVGLIGYGFKLL
jgi:hypothetical protein